MRSRRGAKSEPTSSVLFLTEWAKESPRRVGRVERFRSFKLWGLEWTAYDCDDDRQSRFPRLSLVL